MELEGDLVDDAIIADLQNEQAEYGESSQDISAHSKSQSCLAHRKYHSFEGEIGYKKSDMFVPVTNFSVKCTGYVALDINATTAEGFLVEIIPKDSVKHCASQDAEHEEKR